MMRLVILVLLLGACRPEAPRGANVDLESVAAVDVEAAGAGDGDERFARALARIDDIDSGLPRVEGGYVWWGARDQGRTSHLRRGLVPGDDVEVVLDEQSEFAGAGFVDTGSLSASPDGNSVAFAADANRSDRYGVHIKNLRSGKVDHIVDDADFSVSWNKDGALYFTRFGDDERPRQLWSVQPGVSPEPSLVHEVPATDGEIFVADVDEGSEVFIRHGGGGGVSAFRLSGSPGPARPTLLCR